MQLFCQAQRASLSVQVTQFVVSWTIFAAHTAHSVQRFFPPYVDDIVYVHVHVNAIKTIISAQINQKHEYYDVKFNVSNLRETFEVIV